MAVSAQERRRLVAEYEAKLLAEAVAECKVKGHDMKLQREHINVSWPQTAPGWVREPDQYADEYGCQRCGQILAYSNEDLSKAPYFPSEEGTIAYA